MSSWNTHSRPPFPEPSSRLWGSRVAALSQKSLSGCEQARRQVQGLPTWAQPCHSPALPSPRLTQLLRAGRLLRGLEGHRTEA